MYRAVAQTVVLCSACNAALGRFVQADTLVPEPGNPQALNRYAYTRNSPLRYADPSGHDPNTPLASDTVTSYILREMHTNAGSPTIYAIYAANQFSRRASGSLLVDMSDPWLASTGLCLVKWCKRACPS